MNARCVLSSLFTVCRFVSIVKIHVYAYISGKCSNPMCLSAITVYKWAIFSIALLNQHISFNSNHIIAIL